MKRENLYQSILKVHPLQCGIAEHKKSLHLKLHPELLVQNE